MKTNRIYIKGHGFCPVIAVVGNNYHVLLSNKEVISVQIIDYNDRI